MIDEILEPPAGHDFNTIMLKDFEYQFNNGDKTALLGALEYCLRHEILPPSWVRIGACKNLSNWFRQSNGAKTLDEAFEVVKPKHFKPQKNKAWANAFMILRDVEMEKANKRKRRLKTESAADIVSVKYGINQNIVKEICRACKETELGKAIEQRIKKGGYF